MDTATAFVALISKFAFAAIQERGALVHEHARTHTMVYDPTHDRTPLLFIHRSLASRIVQTSSSLWHAAASFQVSNTYYVLCSVYMPDSSKTTEAFVHAIDTISASLRLLVAARPPNCPELPRIVLCGDFNTEFEGDGVHAFRTALLHGMSSDWCLEWDSKRRFDSNSWTIMHKSSKRKYVLDHCASSSHVHVDVKIAYDMDWASDHKPLLLTLSKSKALLKKKLRYNNAAKIQWDNSDFKKYIAQYLQQPCLEDGANIHVIQTSLERIVREAPSFPSRRRPLPVPLKNAFAILAEAESGGDQDEIHAASKAVFRARRAAADSSRTAAFLENSNKLLRATNKQLQQQPPQQLVCAGVPTENRDKWRNEIATYYSNLYHDSSAKGDCVDKAERLRLLSGQRNTLADLRSKAALSARISIPLSLVLECRAHYTKSIETAPGADGVGWYLLMKLHDSDVLKITQAFERRLNGDASDGGLVGPWSQTIVSLIPKLAGACKVNDFRPISLQCVLQKWFCAVLARLLDTYAAPLPEEVLGFREGRQPLEITESIRTIICKRRQYGHHTAVLQADIRKAFDSMDHGVLIQALQAAHAPPRLTYALMQEHFGVMMNIQLGEVRCHEGILLHSSGRQGSTETPSLWNRYLCFAAEKAKARFLDEGLGVEFQGETDDFSCSFMAWADDIYFIAESEVKARRMFEIFTQEIKRIGLTWKPESLQLLDTSATHSHAVAEYWDVDLTPVALPKEVWEIRCVPSLVALGVKLDREGSSMASFHHRTICFWHKWHMVRKHFCDRRVPLLLRVSRFYLTFGRVLLYGAGGWRLSKELLKGIERIEHICLRQMLCRFKRDDETSQDYWDRVNSCLRNLKQNMKHIPLALQACHLYFGWAGHIIRAGEPRYIALLTTWRDQFWFRSHDGPEHGPERRPLLARRGRPTAWEHGLEAHVGLSWQELCQDRSDWATRKVVAASRLWASVLNRRPLLISHQVPVPHISTKLQSSCPPCNMKGISLLCCADNLQVVQQINGRWGQAESSEFRAQVKTARWLAHAISVQTGLEKWPGYQHYHCHITRQYNGRADACANRALDEGDFFEADGVQQLKKGDRLILCSDGASRGNPGPSAVGIVLFRIRSNEGVEEILSMGKRIQNGTNVQAEFEACVRSLQVLRDWFGSRYLPSHVKEGGGGATVSLPPF
jgi:ribonuclease HI